MHLYLGLGALAVLGLGEQIEEELLLANLDRLSAEHLDLAFCPVPSTELFGLGRDLELRQARRVGLERGERFVAGLLAQVELDLASGGAGVGIEGRGEDAVLHPWNGPAARGN